MQVLVILILYMMHCFYSTCTDPEALEYITALPGHNRRRASCLRMPFIRRPTYGASRWTTGQTERRGIWTTF